MIKTGNDCLACFMKQVLTTVKLSTDDQQLQRRLIVDAGEMLRDFSEQVPPPVNAVRYYRHIAQHTGVDDPFYRIKKAATDYACSLEGRVLDTIESAPDPLGAAIRFAIAGNVLDNGAQHQLDPDAVLADCLRQRPVIDNSAELLARLIPGAVVLYLADNCGEIILDKILVGRIMELGCRVTLAVRGRPIINDALMEDAVDCGLDRICEVIDNGSDVPGTVPTLCSEKFQQAYWNADVIISKGMGNFECLLGERRPIYYLFTVKCSNVRDSLRRIYPGHPIVVGSAMLLGDEPGSVRGS